MRVDSKNTNDQRVVDVKASERALHKLVPTLSVGAKLERKFASKSGEEEQRVSKVARLRIPG